MDTAVVGKRSRQGLPAVVEAPQDANDLLVTLRHLGLVDIIELQRLLQGKYMLGAIVSAQRRTDRGDRGLAARIAKPLEDIGVPFAGDDRTNDPHPCGARNIAHEQLPIEISAPSDITRIMAGGINRLERISLVRHARRGAWAGAGLVQRRGASRCLQRRLIQKPIPRNHSRVTQTTTGSVPLFSVSLAMSAVCVLPNKPRRIASDWVANGCQPREIVAAQHFLGLKARLRPGTDVARLHTLPRRSQ